MAENGTFQRVCCKLKVLDCFAVFFYMAITVFGAILLARVWFGYGFIQDTAEHIHASWLVSAGEVPYRDFFEHHNPLLWYLFAPVTQLFYRDANIIYIARIIAVVGWFAILYQLYVIIRDYFGGKNTARIALLFLLSMPFWFDAQNLRPDIFMQLFILSAVRRFFMYMDDNRRKNLMLSYLYWSVAFLFLQKAVIAGAGFAGANLWLVVKKKKSWKECAVSAIPALLLLSAAAGYFWSENALGAWYRWNVSFNRAVMEYYGNYSVRIGKKFYWIAYVNAFFAVRFSRFDDNKELVWLAILVVTVVSLFQFAPYSQYFTLYFIMASVYIGRASELFFKNKKLWKLCLAEIAAVYLGTCLLALIPSGGAKVKKMVSTSEAVIRNISANEAVLNGGFGNSFNLFNPNADYFWFGFQNAVKIAVLYGFGDFDYNAVIKRNKPEYLFLSDEDALDSIAIHHQKWLIYRNGKVLKRAEKDKKWLKKIVPIDYSYMQVDVDWIRTNYEKKELATGTIVWWRRGKNVEK